MIGVVIPAHNEEEAIARCVRHAIDASADLRLAGERVEIVVVADACTDRTEVLGREAGATLIAIEARNVGAARAAGADFLLRRGVRWLAFTDADTWVSPDWIAEQLALEADVVCGTVAVADWDAHGEHVALLQAHFAETYFDVEAHCHVHGANLGVSAAAYLRAGGFRPLACGEDIDLVAALEDCGATIVRSARPRVVTSARQAARAPGGFAEALVRAVARRLAGGPAHIPATRPARREPGR